MFDNINLEEKLIEKEKETPKRKSMQEHKTSFEEKQMENEIPTRKLYKKLPGDSNIKVKNYTGGGVVISVTILDYLL